MALYQISKLAPKRWQIAKFGDTPGWLAQPAIVKSDAKGRKEAEKLARKLAGETGKIRVLAGTKA